MIRKWLRSQPSDAQLREKKQGKRTDLEFEQGSASDIAEWLDKNSGMLCNLNHKFKKASAVGVDSYMKVYAFTVSSIES